MDIRKFKDVIAKRECTNDEAYWEVEKCWDDLVEVLCEDMPGTISTQSALQGNLPS